MSSEPAASARRPYIRTVLGPVDPEAFGLTLMHEHLITDRAHALGLADRPVESLQAVDEMVRRLDAAHQAGVTAFVDVGTQMFGPSPMTLLCVARSTPIQIVSSVGTMTSDWHPVPAWVCPPATPATIARHLIELADEGQNGSGVRAGILKAGTGERDIADVQEAALRGTALAQQESGLAILTHTHFTKQAERQVDILEDAGADLARVVIGHIGWGSDSGDLELHARLARRGVMLGLDMIGHAVRPLEEYAQIVVDLVDAGFASQLILSHDRTVLRRGLILTGDHLDGHFTTISQQFLPMLSERGIDDDVLNLITVVNPRRVLAIDPARYPRASSPPAPEPMSVIPFQYPWGDPA